MDLLRKLGRYSHVIKRGLAELLGDISSQISVKALTAALHPCPTVGG